MNIRRAELGDEKAITLVLMGAFDSLRERYTYGAYAATIGTIESNRERLDEGPIWVAESERGIEGTISAVIERDVCYIRGMGVAPWARGRGAGRQLLDACLEHAKSVGATMARLHTTEFLHAAIGLYEQAGFMVVPNEDRPDLFGTPLIAMERLI